MKKIVKQIAGKEGARPATSILNPAFEYQNSTHTDLAAKFAKIRAEQSAQQPVRAVVTKIVQRGGK